LKMNKRGDSRLLYFFLFFGFVVVGVAIAWGFWVFFSSEIDVVEKENVILNNQLVRVLSNGNEFNSENFNEELIMDNAGLDEGVFNEGIFYFKIDVVRESGVESISRGNPDFEIQCELEGKGFAKCYEDNLVLFDNEEEIILYILTGSNNLGVSL